MESLKEINWLISLLAAIPLSIAANLLTPYIRDWFGRRSSRQAALRLKQLEHEYEFISEMEGSDKELTRYILWSMLRLLTYFAIASAISSLSTMVESVIRGLDVYPIAGFFSAYLYLVGVIRAQGAAKTLRQLRRFDTYKSEMEERIRNLREIASRKEAPNPGPQADA